MSKAIELDPELAWAYYYRAVSYSYKRNRSLAITDLEKVLELSTDPELTQLAQKGIRQLR